MRDFKCLYCNNLLSIGESCWHEDIAVYYGFDETIYYSFYIEGNSVKVVLYPDKKCHIAYWQPHLKNDMCFEITVSSLHLKDVKNLVRKVLSMKAFQ